MDKKAFIAIISILIIGSIGYITFGVKREDKPRLGLEQPDQGRKHIQEGQKQNYDVFIPTSGPHAQPVAWQAYEEQIPNENIIHNMEHGGVIISYRPDLDTETVNKLKALFTKPYSDAKFSPNKAIVMPREDQKKPIVLASWTRILELDSYEQQTMIDYYLGNVNKSPEPNAS